MYRLDILQNQWLMLGLAGGLVLALGLTLLCLALWRPRPDAAQDSDASSPRKGSRWFLPGLLVLTYVSVVVFAIVYTLAMASHPPNW